MLYSVGCSLSWIMNVSEDCNAVYINLWNNISDFFCSKQLVIVLLFVHFWDLASVDDRLLANCLFEFCLFCFASQFMGHMDVISFISDGFNVYFPIAIVVLCFLTFFKVGTWLLHLLGFQQFIGDDEMTQELVDEGAELVKRGCGSVWWNCDKIQNFRF